ncbi:MAG: Ig-like domain-containing protein, partial [Anaerolineales bacterium]|nr:Ig-like domain-containing protein [Anaerolineales bacterium]
MKNRARQLLHILFLFVLLSTSCSNHQETPDRRTLSIEVDDTQVGPTIHSTTPLDGQRLDLEPAIQIVFDRDMDQKKTEEAWSFFGPDEEIIPGKVEWLDERTFEFAPKVSLQPATQYTGCFSTHAADIDGNSPAEEFRVEFKTAALLAVGQVFPGNDSEDVEITTNITVLFNQPVVPLTLIEEQETLPKPFEFSPPINGQGEWVNSSVYVFQPDSPLNTGTRYTVRVKDDLQSINGSPFAEPYIWQFSTSEPAIHSFYLKDGIRPKTNTIKDVLLDQEFVVTFNQSMDEESAISEITLVNRETGQPFPIDLNWNENHTMLSIKPVGKYKIASFYDLTIGKNTLAQDGSPLKEGMEFKISTVTLPRIVSFDPEPDSQAEEYQSYMRIFFNSPMNLDSLKDKIQVIPEP